MRQTRRLNPTATSLALSLALACGLQAAITDNLVVHLKFDSNFNDASGRGNAGQAVGNPTFGAGLIGPGSVVVNTSADASVTDYVTLDSLPDVSFGSSTDFTVSLWVKLATYAGDPAFAGNKNWASGGNVGWVIATHPDGHFQWNWKEVDYGRVDYDGPGGTLNDGQWHHLAVAFERAGNARSYLDGVLVDTRALRAPGAAPSSIDTTDLGLATNVGTDGTGAYTDGGNVSFEGTQLDDLGIWQRAITGDEVAQIHAAGLRGIDLQSSSGVAAFFKNTVPSPGTPNAPANTVISVQLEAGPSPIDQASIRMFVDNLEVVAAKNLVGRVTTISYQPSQMLAAASAHSVRVEARDTAAVPNSLTNQWSFTVANYTTVPAAFARPLAAANTAGFRMRTVWAPPGTPGQANTLARANAQLNGTLIDPGTGLPFDNAAVPGPNPDGSYSITTVIHFDQTGINAGNWPGGDLFPGIDDPAADSFADETITWIPLQAGYYRAGVNSDDGFELRAGAEPRSPFGSVALGAYDGGRGAGDSIFDFVIPVAGTYGFRLIHEEGGGDANLEFFTVDLATGAKILVNDGGDARALRAYQRATGAGEAPYLRDTVPAAGATDIKTDTAIRAFIVDGTRALVAGTVQMTFNGAAVTPALNKVGNVTTVSYQPAAALAYRSTNTVALTFGDGTTLVTETWQFVTQAASQMPSITGQWDFDTGDLGATIGLPLEYMSAGARAATRFGSTADFGIPNIGGQPARVLRFAGASARDIGYLCKHGAVPNGGGSKVNRWTMIMDLFIPTDQTGTYFSFGQIDSLSNSNDGELFIQWGDRGTGDGVVGGIGISGTYTADDGTTYLKKGQWHRVAFAVDHTDDNSFSQAVISKFIDGVKFSDQMRGTGILDGRHTLFSTMLLFADEDGESSVAYVNSVQFRNYKMSDAEIAALGGPSPAGIPTVSGQWDFEEGNVTATIGSDLIYRGTTEAATTFSSAQIGGQTAKVMGFPACSRSQGYLMYHGGLANGGGQYVNQYTLVMDIMFSAAGNAKWRGLFQTDTNNANDGDIFLNTANGLGISGQYQGTVPQDTWCRVGLAFDLTSKTLGKYINGTLVNLQTLSASSGGVDQRWSLSSGALVFSDEDGETAPGFVNSIQFRPLRLSDAQMAALGGASAAGIPLELPFFAPPIQRPTMTVARSGNNITISWPANATGFTLERSGAVPSATWTPVAGVVNNSVTLPPGQAAEFFRLRR